MATFQIDEHQAQPNDPLKQNPPTRFAIACRMLRNAGLLDIPNLPDLLSNESPVDWLVRIGIADTPEHAAEALLVAKGISPQLLDEVQAEIRGD